MCIAILPAFLVLNLICFFVNVGAVVRSHLTAQSLCQARRPADCFRFTIASSLSALRIAHCCFSVTAFIARVVTRGYLTYEPVFTSYPPSQSPWDSGEYTT